VEGNDVGVTPWSIEHPLTLDVTRCVDFAGPLPRYEDEVRSVCEWLVQASAGRDWRTVFRKMATDPALFDYEAEDEFMRGR